MDEWMLGLIGLAAGGMLGAAAAAAMLLARNARTQADLGNARTQTQLLEARVADRDAEINRLRQVVNSTRDEREEAKRRVATLTEQLAARERQFDEQKSLLEDAKNRLSDAFAATGAQALKANNEHFLDLAKKAFEGLMQETRGDAEKRHIALDTLVKPIRELLERQSTAVHEIEKKREVAYRGLEEQIKSIASSHEKLNTETNRLVSALRRPEQRGQWGEMQLRNVVEMAGMTKHCDFVEQPVVQHDDRTFRPDMVVKLPGGGTIVVDAKVALDAYLDSLESGADSADDLRRHARQVAEHVRKLASKQYWNHFERTPRIVVMFMPLESALSAALEANPALHADAMRSHVLIATPTLLVALLRAVAYGWQQEDVAANAREISAVGRDLYDRLGRFTTMFERVGTNLDAATRAYNKAVASLEARLLPSARDLKRLHATTEKELRPPAQVGTEVRAVASIELKEGEPVTPSQP